jgi:lycopene cyclase domain-containing protein
LAVVFSPTVTYFRFHLIFNLPLLAVLFFSSRAEPWTQGEMTAVALVLLAVVVFTTPWDNLAAKWGIWGFPRAKYSFRLGYLPVEEYAFFVLQSLNVMLGVRVLFHFFPGWHRLVSTEPGRWTFLCLGASILPWILIGGQLRAWRRRAGSRVNYAVHLAWFLPVIYSQWVLAPTLFGAHAGLLLLVTAIFGFYYTWSDVVAIHGGTWFFDERQITGFKFGGLLPWEEAAFFFLTSLLVAQSYLLLLPAEQR